VQAKPDGGYQGEEKLEADFINQLKDQGYEYVQLKDEAGLLKNLRRQLELFNDVAFSDSEW
jgi:type I restriction enzyme R subunit